MIKQIIADFWATMGTNDFGAAARFLHPDFTYYMPQTREFLEGPSAFAVLNTAYPTEGRWRFDVRSIICDGVEAVSDVGVTDGAIEARAITFHTLCDGLILRQIEYWPDPYLPPVWREKWMSLRDGFPD